MHLTSNQDTIRSSGNCEIRLGAKVKHTLSLKSLKVTELLIYPHLYICSLTGHLYNKRKWSIHLGVEAQQKLKSCLNKPPYRSESAGLTAQFQSRESKAFRVSSLLPVPWKMFHLFTSNKLFPLSPKHHLVIKPAEVPIQTSSVTHFNWRFNVRSEKLLSSTAFYTPIMCSTNSKPSVCHRIHFFSPKSFLRIQ